jgi:hypothetical protein
MPKIFPRYAASDAKSRILGRFKIILDIMSRSLDDLHNANIFIVDMKMLFVSSLPRYSLLDSGQDVRPTSIYRSAIRAILFTCAFSLTLCIGVFLGRWSSMSSPAVPTSLMTKSFVYDRDFSYPPSNLTNAAWQTLFPARGGFFTHAPSITQRSTLSVFHQLHCLVSYSGGLWNIAH